MNSCHTCQSCEIHVVTSSGAEKRGITTQDPHLNTALPQELCKDLNSMDFSESPKDKSGSCLSLTSMAQVLSVQIDRTSSPPFRMLSSSRVYKHLSMTLVFLTEGTFELFGQNVFSLNIL